MNRTREVLLEQDRSLRFGCGETVSDALRIYARLGTAVALLE